MDMKKRIIRVFPTKTNATPTDELVRIRETPSFFDEADEVHVSVTFTWDIPIAEWLAKQWEPVATVKIGGPAYNEPGGDFIPGMYMRHGYVITSRGCPNRCWFCAVPKREGGMLRELPVTDGWILTDDNLLACSPGHIDEVFAMLARQPHKPQFTGGKDSLAALLWVREHITTNFTTVFCDTGWEHPLTYEYINRIADRLNLDLVTLKSPKYDGMVGLAKQKKRWPSTRARFCTQELKTKPCIDYVLDNVQDNILMIQGIRAAESPNRAAMSKQCTYFKYYFEPYGYDKAGKPKMHTYRGHDVRVFRKQYADDLLRPVFDWSAQQVIDYILSAGLEPNPLYTMGYKRVGCWPCVMASQRDILNISRQSPDRIEQIATLEHDLKSSFFGPDKIPAHAITSGEKYPTINDVVQYVKWQNATGSLFDDDTATSCMSFYGLCE